MISVIIPYHNVDRKLFGMCMQSIFAQTYQNFEIVLVNDGSEKEYLVALEEAGKLDSRVRIIHQECKGASGARNRGILESKGDYIAFVDADDMIMPYYLEEALQVLETYQADFVAGGVRFVYQLDQMLPLFQVADKQQAGYNVQVFEGKDIDEFKHHLVSSRQLISYAEGNVDRGPVARLVRKELLAQCPFHEELIMWEDMVWNLELLDYCSKVCAVPKTWYLYYQNPQSMIHCYRVEVIKEVEKTMEYIESILDIETDDGFETFGDYVYDNLRRIYRLYFSRKECPLTLKERIKEYDRIYMSEPWNVFGTNRYYKRTSGKNKLMSFFYRKKLFFTVFGVKEVIKKKLGIV